MHLTLGIVGMLIFYYYLPLSFILRHRPRKSSSRHLNKPRHSSLTEPPEPRTALGNALAAFVVGTADLETAPLRLRMLRRRR